jgi:hypothetical protein
LPLKIIDFYPSAIIFFLQLLILLLQLSMLLISRLPLSFKLHYFLIFSLDLV